MKRYRTFRDHQSLQEELRLMRSSLRKSEHELKEDTKKALVSLPLAIFSKPTTNQKIVANKPLITNPTGKILSKLVNHTILKKQGFITKFIAGIFLRRAGRKIEKQLLKATD